MMEFTALILVVGLYFIVPKIKIHHIHEEIKAPEPEYVPVKEIDPEEVAMYLEPEIRDWYLENYKKVEEAE